MPVYVVEVNSNDAGAGSTEFGPIYGVLGGIDYDFHASAGTLTATMLKSLSGKQRTIMQTTGVITDAAYFPEQNIHDTGGTQQATAFAPNTFHGEKLQLSVGTVNAALSPALTITLRTTE